MSKRKSDEVLREQHALGLKSRLMLKAFGDLHAEREDQTVTEMIAWFRNEPWDERRAIRYIATLAENRAQFDALEYRARKGEEASAKLHLTKPEPETAS